MITRGRVIFITGKGGTGKTTVAAALALRAAHKGLRTLLVDPASDGRLERLFGTRDSRAGAHRLGDRLDLFRIDPRQLVEDYFTSMLRFSFLSKRLFESSSFNALTAAAPGITEFLTLEKISGWLESGMTRRRRYDLIVVDGPATGHAIKLLRAPRNLLSMVPGGPIARSAQAQVDLLEDWDRTMVVLVALPEDLAVRETIETATALRDEAFHVARPVINRVFPRRFSATEIKQIEALNGGSRSPVVDAAHFAIAARRAAERHVGTLRRALDMGPTLLPLLFSGDVQVDQLQATFGKRLDRTALLE